MTLEELLAKGVPERVARQIVAVDEAQQRGELPPEAIDPDAPHPPKPHRPTGQEIFDSLSPEKQDEMLGPAAAEMVRNGEATLADFVERDGGFIRQKPVEALKAWREEDHPRGGDPKNPGRFSVGGGGGKVPKWERQRRYNGWIRSLGPAEQEALARQFYDKLWNQLRGYFGAIGQPPPELIFTNNITPGMEAQVFADGNGIRQVQMRRRDILNLALRGSLDYFDAALIAHEWRHVFQNAGLFWIGRDQPHDDQPLEEDANAFAAQVRRTIKKNRNRKRKGLPLIQPVPYNPQNIAENIGKDPTTIPYP